MAPAAGVVRRRWRRMPNMPLASFAAFTLVAPKCNATAGWHCKCDTNLPAAAALLVASGASPSSPAAPAPHHPPLAILLSPNFCAPGSPPAPHQSTSFPLPVLPRPQPRPARIFSSPTCRRLLTASSALIIASSTSFTFNSTSHTTAPLLCSHHRIRAFGNQFMVKKRPCVAAAPKYDLRSKSSSLSQSDDAPSHDSKCLQVPFVCVVYKR